MTARHRLRISASVRAAWRRDPQHRARWLAAVRRGVQARDRARRLSLEEIFHGSAEPEPNSSCLLWAGTWSRGFPKFGGGYAYRHIYEAVHGPIPRGAWLVSACGLRACVNPLHRSVVRPFETLTFEEIRAQYISVDARTGCWVWRGRLTGHGYGRIGKHWAHRHVYTLVRGPIAWGLTLDHTCRVRHCVNPSHLEAVPQSVNSRRARAHSRRRAQWALAQGEGDEAGEREPAVVTEPIEWRCECGAVNAGDRVCDLCGSPAVVLA